MVHSPWSFVIDQTSGVRGREPREDRYAKGCVYRQEHLAEFRRNSTTFSKNAIGCHVFGRHPMTAFCVIGARTASDPPAQKTWQTGKLNFFSDATSTAVCRYGAN